MREKKVCLLLMKPDILKNVYCYWSLAEIKVKSFLRLDHLDAVKAHDTDRLKIYTQPHQG